MMRVVSCSYTCLSLGRAQDTAFVCWCGLFRVFIFTYRLILDKCTFWRWFHNFCFRLPGETRNFLRLPLCRQKHEDGPSKHDWYRLQYVQQGMDVALCILPQPTWFVVNGNFDAVLCRTSKTSGHPVSSAAVKPVSETQVAPKQATVSTAPAKQTSAPAPAPASTPAAVSVH